jgi:hypothetical protein
MRCPSKLSALTAEWLDVRIKTGEQQFQQLLPAKLVTGRCFEATSGVAAWLGLHGPAHICHLQLNTPSM